MATAAAFRGEVALRLAFVNPSTDPQAVIEVLRTTMLEADGSPDTAHSTNPVPVVATVEGAALRDGGILADVVPTALELLGIPQPAEMNGKSLLLLPT